MLIDVVGCYLGQRKGYQTAQKAIKTAFIVHCSCPSPMYIDAACTVQVDAVYSKVADELK